MTSLLRAWMPLSALAIAGCLSALVIEGDLVHVLNVEPGKAYQDQIVLRNDQDRMVRVHVKPMDYQQTPIETKYLQPGTIAHSNASWIEVVPVVDISPRSKTPLPFKVTVPANAQPGVHWSTLVLTTPETPLEGNVIATSGTYGVQVVTRQAPLPRGSVALVSSDLVKNNSGQATWRVVIRNTGQVDLNLKGLVELRNSQGALICQVPGQVFRVFPGSEVTYQFPFNNPIAPGTYDATIVLDDNVSNQFTIHTKFVY